MTMIRIPRHIEQLKPYEPGKKGEQLFRGEKPAETAILCSNENNLGPSPKAVSAMTSALQGVNVYPDPLGTQLRDAIAQKLNTTSDRIALGDGSDGILYTLFHSFCEGGDEILTSAGSFISVKVFSSLYKIPLIEVPMKAGYAFDLEAILEQVNERTKIIYLCNPNNPTGTMIGRDELERFLQVIPEHILVLVDEAYCEFAGAISDKYPDSSKLGYDNVMTLRTFSKAYGLAGIRLGYIIGAPYLIQTLIKTQPIFSPGSVAMAGGLGALEDIDFLQKTIEHHLEGLGQHCKTLEEAGIAYIPSYANFVMADMQSAESAQVLCYTLEQQGIKLRKLDAFGLPHCVRISVGTSRENKYFREQLLKMIQSGTIPSTQSALRPSH